MSSTKLVDSGAGTMSDLSKQMRQQRKQFEASMENDEDLAGGGYHLTNIAIPEDPCMEYLPTLTPKVI